MNFIPRLLSFITYITMNHLRANYLLVSIVCVCMGCFSPGNKEAPPPEPPAALPLEILPLESLQAFRTAGKNWQIAGEAFADVDQPLGMKVEAGKGVLANLPLEEERAHIFTQMEHGDMELEMEFLMPKGSNSGLYFQSRYEVQLLDSWGVEQPTFADCGGIYERWDESLPEGQKGFEGHAPRLNASKAPGLWQQLRVVFRAPRFDATGQKISNAMFEEVVHNGMLIHEKVEVSGPTRAAAFEDEVPLAPLMIQGDHGPVAFRNIRYKTYGADSLRLDSLHYALYESKADQLPHFDTLTLIAEGAAKSLDVQQISDQKDYYALRFTGKLVVPTTGDYLFTSLIDDGGDLLIDGKVVVHNEGDPGLDEARGMLHLSAGSHDFELTFYQKVWLANVTVLYEGPGMRKQLLSGRDISGFFKKPEPLALQPGPERPELLRGFVKYGDKKRTHVISVGTPQGVHYSYDLQQAAVLRCWKGRFADVAEMWVGRGIEQLLKPLEMSIETTAGMPLGLNGKWAEETPPEFRFRGYQLNKAGYPSFQFQLNDIQMSDQPMPTEGRLQRKVEFRAGKKQKNCLFRLAEGKKIERLSDGFYRIDGAYYLKIPEGVGAKIVKSGESVVLASQILAEGTQDSLRYEWMW